MSESLTPAVSARQPRLTLSQWLHILLARSYAYLYSRLGCPGCAGLLLLICALTAWGWREQVMLSALKAQEQAQRLAASQANMAPDPTATDSISSQPKLTPPALPQSSDSVELIKHIKAAVLANGLAWPQADYRFTPLSEEGLATMEVRTTLKGPYPKLRQLVTTLLDKEPALGLRELTLTRQNGDAVDVEAKIRWVIFLADGWPPAEAGGQR